MRKLAMLGAREVHVRYTLGTHLVGAVDEEAGDVARVNGE
jgi:hypothetical protein